MKTIQQYLKECNKEEIANAYFYRYAPSVANIDLNDKKISDIRNRIKEKIKKTIDFLCNSKAKQGEEPCFLLAYHIINSEEIGDDIRFTMMPYSQSTTSVLCGHSFILASTEEIMAYYVSDNYTTQYYLEDLLAWFLYEATFFGYEREDVEKERQTLDCRYNEVKNGTAKTVPAKEVFEELGMGTEWVPEERNTAEQEREYEIMKIIGTFNCDCLKREWTDTKESYNKQNTNE